MTGCKVLPYENVLPHIVSLSVPDASAPKSWAIEILFWPLKEPGDFGKAHGNLTEGLSRLIADVPVLTGRLASGPTNHPLDLTIVVHEGAAVEFPYEDASATEAIPPFEHLLNDGLPLTEHLRKVVTPKISLEPVVQGSPVFCTKATRLRGGIALAVGFGHSLTDGITASGMERIWAMHTLDVSHGLPFRRYKVPTPDEDITRRLSTPSHQDTESDLDSFLRVVSASEARNHLHKDAASAKDGSEKEKTAIMGHLAAMGEKPEIRGFALWKFTSVKLSVLKEAASVADPEKWISTMDALAALLWSRIAHHQKQSTKGFQDSICLFMISIRQRIEPTVPNEYIGNVFTPAVAECALATLESDKEGLKAAAQAMRKANQEWTQSRWEAWLSKIMSLPVDQALSVDRETFFRKHNFNFNDYSRFQSNTVNWGAPLGQVARTRYLKRALPAGAFGAHVHPRLSDGSLEVSLMCSEALRQSLLGDEIFMRYAEFMCYHP